jgi:hypothetical protein
MLLPAGAAELPTGQETGAAGVWQRAPGEGFRESVRRVGVSAVAGVGLQDFGSYQAHDFALAGVSCGRMLGGVKGEGSFWRGNWELHAEILAGAQVDPVNRYLFGLTPHLRYNFAAGSRAVPFLDAGIGFTATNIGPPDLGKAFQFNSQAGGGVNWFLRDDLAISLESRFVHLSSACLSMPNNGVNAVLLMVGVSRYLGEPRNTTTGKESQ